MIFITAASRSSVQIYVKPSVIHQSRKCNYSVRVPCNIVSRWFRYKLSNSIQNYEIYDDGFYIETIYLRERRAFNNSLKIFAIFAEKNIRNSLIPKKTMITVKIFVFRDVKHEKIHRYDVTTVTPSRKIWNSHKISVKVCNIRQYHIVWKRKKSIKYSI